MSEAAQRAPGEAATEANIDSSPNIATLGRFLQAFLAGGVDAALEYVHPDIVAEEPPSLPYGGRYRGKEQFADLMREIGETVEVQVIDHSMLDAGDTVVLKLRAKFTSRDTGAVAEMPVVELYTFTDGLISRAELFYKDTNAWLEAIATPTATH